MPRTGKGSKAHPQRTDLNDAVAQSTVGTGDDREHGARKADLDAQQAVPMGTTPPATDVPTPGAFGSLTRPTERPDEPITAGLPSGPGPGPEALLLGNAQTLQRRQFRARMYAEQLARMTDDPALKRILGD